jgi:hypothetical protein
MHTIPIIACIDVEPDEREIDSTAAKDWQGFEELTRFLGTFRPRLEQATRAPARFSWFLRMDPQIEHTYGLSWWVAKRYRDALATFESAGDEIGLHVHAWRWDQDAARWISDHGDQGWIAHCVHVALDGYHAAFGRPCRSFRYGDHFMNNETMNALEDLGIQFDLTLEPGVKAIPGKPGELHTGSLPDYTNTPTWPYQPSRTDFRKESQYRQGAPWAIPLSTGRRRLPFPGVERAASALGFAQVRPLNFALKRGRFSQFMNDALARDEAPHLAPVVRTDVGVKPVEMARLQRNLESILSHPLVKRFRLVRPAEAVQLLRLPQRATM